MTFAADTITALQLRNVSVIAFYDVGVDLNIDGQKERAFHNMI